MKRIEALQELLAKVEAGEKTLNVVPQWSKQETMDALRAANGSLDAAKALHEAVLPGWGFKSFHLAGEVFLRRTRSVDSHYGHSDGNPARAWLIAIIKALISTSETGKESE